MTPGELQRIAFDFRLARAVSCALELGVFEALACGAADASDVARRCGLDPRCTGILLGALAGSGLLERDESGYRLPEALADQLLPDREDFRGNLLLHDLWHWTSWARLDRCVREGRPVQRRDGDPHLTDPGILERFLPNYVSAMEQSLGDAPRRLADALAALEPRRVLDLGAGTGAHLVALMHRVPAARGTLAELGFSLDAARERVRRSGLSARVEVTELDFERDPLPAGHDLVLVSRVLMGLPPERASALLQRCAQAVEPGGHVAVHDYDPETRVGGLLSLDMLLNTGGEAHAPRRVAAWLAGAGLRAEPERRILPYTYLSVARRPEEPR